MKKISESQKSELWFKLKSDALAESIIFQEYLNSETRRTETVKESDKSHYSAYLRNLQSYSMRLKRKKNMNIIVD